MLNRSGMLFRPLLIGLSLLTIARADERVQQMTSRLAEEASVFARVAPDVIGTEKLRQRAIKLTHRRFHPHVVDQSAQPKGPEWQDRELVSEYGFSTLADNPGALREFRRVLTVDGRDVTKSKDSPDVLAKSILSQDDHAKRKLLEQFEKYGLVGTVTDFGQLILLFEGKNIDQYEFAFAGTRMLAADSVLVFSYRQIDGPERLTVWDGKNTIRQKTSGEIWVRESDGLPVRITLNAVRGLGDQAVSEQAQVDYAMSSYGIILPVSVTHREYRAGVLSAENMFTYSGFRKFGASTVIQFTTGQSRLR